MLDLDKMSITLYAIVKNKGYQHLFEQYQSIYLDVLLNISDT